MTFYHNGQTLSLRAKSTNRHWEAPSACAARLLSPLEIRPRRFQPAKPALNAEGIYMAKQWKSLMKRGGITGVFEVHIVDAIPVVEAQFVRMVDAKKRAILEERFHTNAEAKARDQEDPLEALAADHPLRPTLEKYLKPGSKPVMQPLQHLSPDKLDELGQQMQRLMDKGWISHSRSPWGVPVLFAPKKDGSLLRCIDYRARNKMTHKDATPLPNLSELRDRLVNMRVFIAIDIRDAYHCIMIRPEDREQTAFQTRFGHFEYNRLTTKLLGNKYDTYVISYLNDILIFSTDMSSHIQHVNKVLKTLAEHCLHVKPSKCQWTVDEVEFCGHRVGKDGLSIAPSKVTAVRERPRPTNSLELLSFMGLVNYIKEYIPERIGLLLRQMAGTACKMQPAKTRYPVHEQELLRLVKSIRANRHYLIGRPFRAFVDHKSLIYLQEQPHLSCHQAGWVEFLQQFDFSVEYLLGTWNSIADFLSRDPTYALKCATCQAKIDVVTAIVQPEITITTHMPTKADWTRALAFDDFGKNILLTIDCPQENLSGHARRFRTVDSPPDRFLMYHNCWYVPDSLQGPLLQIHHDSLANGGHSGVQRTLAKLLESNYWPNMERDVYQYIRTCPTCQRHKRAAPIGFLRSLPIPTLGMAQLFLEQAFRHTGLPHTIVSNRDPKWLSEFWRYLMRALNVKQELLLARHQQTDGKVENAIKMIKGVLSPFRDYAGSNWKSLLPTLEYNYNRTPQTSMRLSPFEIDLGRVPRVPTQWVAPNPGEMIRQSARTAVERRIKEFADVSRIVQQRLRDAQDQQAKYYDRKKHTEAYREGDKVLLHREGIVITSVTTRNKKLAEQWIGPFTVRGKGPHPDTYELKLSKEFTGLHPVFHVSRSLLRQSPRRTRTVKKPTEWTGSSMQDGTGTRSSS
ncbi:hypothetical protein PhCBS80983_g01411 [Powellomyces hirtus]|uniref:Integrase catalytic domain-containing protein n=1 Tax=Powellomyces hirtus TaxID=109895 RepID=A0A507EAV5_9FUNG|nr:hypothetical protein PhCBS80983_g01411 [Powellomyces hirtus]